MVDGVVSVGVMTPHDAIGPAEEFEVMAPGRLATRVVRVPVRASGASTLVGPPASTAALSELTSSRFLDEAADVLAEESLDVLGYASTSSAYAIGFDAETAMLSRLAARLRIPAVGTCASAVLAFEMLSIERIALVTHPGSTMS
jgi:maleate isomerase